MVHASESEMDHAHLWYAIALRAELMHIVNVVLSEIAYIDY